MLPSVAYRKKRNRQNNVTNAHKGKRTETKMLSISQTNEKQIPFIDKNSQTNAAYRQMNRNRNAANRKKN